MKICVVCADYPSEKSSTFSFVKQLVDEFANQGHQCFVVSPFSVSKYRCLHPVKQVSHSVSGGSVSLIRPNYLSFSTLRIGRFSLTKIFYKRAIKKAISLLPEKPDVFYAHFWSSAFAVKEFAEKWNLPLFVASGESCIENLGNPYLLNELVSGVICVSQKNKKESIELGLTTERKCSVIPNAINRSVFYKMDTKINREKYGFPQNAFIVAFVGWFNNRKGVKRVSEAVKKLNNPNIFSIFIGSGPENPDCENILFKGPLKHDGICSLLNCADVFVLPTLAEGCCNAIIEAMACGLPIVSSDCDFNDDILDDSNSIRVNPSSIDEIAEAINRLYENEDLRLRLGEISLAKAAALTIENRAKKIIEFMNVSIGDRANACMV